jgi:hypothetical protein
MENTHSMRVVLMMCAGMAFGCARLPRVTTSAVCNPQTPSAVAVQTVDSARRIIPFADVVVTRSNKALRFKTSTNSSGETRFSLEPGSYSVGIGDGLGAWQSAVKSIEVRPGCVVTVKAALLKHEIDPNWSR